MSDSASGPQRPIKRRASQACHVCRMRKVKCDLVESGSPCHNCQVDGSECTTSISKRSRRYRLQKGQHSQYCTSQSVLWPQSLPPWITPSPTLAEPRDGEATSTTATQPNQGPISPTSQSLPAHEFHAQTSVVPNSTRPTPASSHESSLHVDLPSYIHPSRREMESDELDYLSRRGALSTPELHLRDQLFLSFVLYVQSFLPVLDLQEFIDAIEGRSDQQVSLILFQAVMFAGTAFVDLHYLREAGFEDRLAARAYFFQKIKLLYDFGWETDRVVLTQAILLHQYWYVSTSDQKDPWYWLGVCISLATGVGLNQPGTYSAKDAKKCRIWRRIWWTCVARDRTLATIMRKPMRIKDDEINLHRLKFKDFDTQPLCTKTPLFQDCRLITKCVGKVMLADMFMSKLNLLLISGRIINHSYNLQGFAGSMSDWTLFYTPRKKVDLDTDRYCELLNELDQWAKMLNNYCRLDYQDDDNADEFPVDVMYIHRSVLKLLYLMTQEALYRPLTSPAGLQQQTDQLQCTTGDSSALEARSCVSQATSEMAGIIQNLCQQNLLGYMPPLSVSCILTAVASLLVEIRLVNKSPTDVPGHLYHECVRSLTTLRNIWPVTKGTIAMINQMTTNSQIWFARTLKMLSKPVPVALNGVSAAKYRGHNHPNSEVQHRLCRSSSGISFSEAETLGQPVIPVLPQLDHRHGLSLESVVHGNSMASTYLASMYPFPWTLADLDFYNELDPPITGVSFLDHSALSPYDMGEALGANLSAYPSSLAPTVENVSNMHTTLLPETWKSGV